MDNRIELTQHNYDQMFVELEVALDKARNKHGNMSYISSHEILGKLHEEVREFDDEIIANDIDKQIKELSHIGVIVISGLASLQKIKESIHYDSSKSNIY